MTRISNEHLYSAASEILKAAADNKRPELKGVRNGCSVRAFQLLKFERMIVVKSGVPSLTDLGRDRVKAYGYVVYPPLDLTKNPR